MGDDYKSREVELYRQQSEDVDIVITTALSRTAGRRLITAEMGSR